MVGMFFIMLNLINVVNIVFIILFLFCVIFSLFFIFIFNKIKKNEKAGNKANAHSSCVEQFIAVYCFIIIIPIPMANYYHTGSHIYLAALLIGFFKTEKQCGKKGIDCYFFPCYTVHIVFVFFSKFHFFALSLFLK